MKKIKIVFWLLLFGFLALVIFQNKHYFLTTHSFQLNLLFYQTQTPPIHNVLVFLGFFFIGLLIAYFYGLYGQFRLGRTIKNLNATVAAQAEEIEGLRQRAPVRPEQAAEAVDASAEAAAPPPPAADA